MDGQYAAIVLHPSELVIQCQNKMCHFSTGMQWKNKAGYMRQTGLSGDHAPWPPTSVQYDNISLPQLENKLPVHVIQAAIHFPKQIFQNIFGKAKW